MLATLAIVALTLYLLAAEPLLGRNSHRRLLLPMLLHVLVDLRAAFVRVPVPSNQ